MNSSSGMAHLQNQIQQKLWVIIVKMLPNLYQKLRKLIKTHYKTRVAIIHFLNFEHKLRRIKTSHKTVLTIIT